MFGQAREVIRDTAAKVAVVSENVRAAMTGLAVLGLAALGVALLALVLAARGRKVMA